MRFNPITNTWTIEAAMPPARHGLGVASIDDKLYVIGGGGQIQDYCVMGE